MGGSDRPDSRRLHSTESLCKNEKYGSCYCLRQAKEKAGTNGFAVKIDFSNPLI